MRYRITLAALLLVIGPAASQEPSFEALEQVLKDGGVIFASWNAHTPGRTGQCHCPDGQDYATDPYTGNQVRRDCAKEYGCREDIVEPKARIFWDKEEQKTFQAACPAGACSGWLVREATEEEILTGFVSAMGWQIAGDRYNPGPDAWKVKAPSPNNREGKIIGAGADAKEAIKGACFLAKKGWQIVPVLIRWQVIAPPEGRRVLVMNGVVSDGAGTVLPAVAEGETASSAMKAAIKKAQKAEKK